MVLLVRDMGYSEEGRGSGGSKAARGRSRWQAESYPAALR